MLTDKSTPLATYSFIASEREFACVKFSSRCRRKAAAGKVTMKIQILELIEGAKKAEGLTVIIDVFRAMTLECCLFAQGASLIYPIGSLEDAFALKKAHPDWVLCGERGGARVEGCDYGNSPSQIAGCNLTGRTIIHSTSAGTQGIVNAVHADEIICAALVNADAVASYIRFKDPETVSIVAMGEAGLRRANEDLLCAEYIRSVLEGNPFPVQERADALRHNGGEHFFDPATQEVFPEQDFYICTECNQFPFVNGISRNEEGMLTARPIWRAR